MASRSPFRATYRVQLHPGFDFDDAAAVAGYLADLGVSHFYASPYLQARAGKAYTIAGSPTEPMAVVAVTLETGRVDVLRRSAERVVEPAYISVPETIEFPTEGGVTAHGFFYRPVNPEYSAPAGELPPLIVYVHGGPTSAVSNALDISDFASDDRPAARHCLQNDVRASLKIAGKHKHISRGKPGVGGWVHGDL